MADIHKTLTDIISRINACAEANGVQPETVVRNITGDPRGLRRLISKLEHIKVIDKGLKSYPLHNASQASAACHAAQPPDTKATTQPVEKVEAAR